MKKINIVIAVLALLSLVSCERVLNKEPLTKFTNDNYWTSETNVEMYANYFYNEWDGYSGSTFYFATLNDNQASNGFTTWKSTSVDASNGTWSGAYTEIRRANVLIEKVPGIESMSESAKAKWIGIGRLYRAWQHYKLVRSFGDCYYVDTVLDPGVDEAVLYGARQDRDAVMDKVLEDLNFAVANIPETSGRAEYNRAVAQAMKSEICLYEGTFCKYRTAADNGKAADDARATKFLNECKTASKAIMDNSNYSLSPSYVDVYQSLDLGSSPASKEMIMFKKYVYGVMGHSLVDYCCSSTMQHGMTKDAFDSYLFIDGECLANTSKDKNDKATFTAYKDTDNPSITNYVGDLSSVLAVRDPRLAKSIDAFLQYQGTPYMRKGTDGLGMNGTSSTGYGVSKFDNLTVEYAHRPNGSSNETDAPIFWLANVILNYAEACVESGDNANAVSAINMLRKRAGMPNLSASPKHDPANDMGVSDLIWEVRRERRCELMYDNDDRYWCLIRWHQLDKLDTKKNPDIVRGAWVGSHVKTGAGVTAAEIPELDGEGYINRDSRGTRTYEAKHYLRPIPSNQIDLNPQIGQNPGW